MALITEPYNEQAQIWPNKGRHILAQFDEDTIIVYQAYNSLIGRYVADHGTFGGGFSYSRMSWIKPNFLWMMYRSGWGRKENRRGDFCVTPSTSVLRYSSCRSSTFVLGSQQICDRGRVVTGNDNIVCTIAVGSRPLSFWDTLRATGHSVRVAGRGIGIFREAGDGRGYRYVGICEGTTHGASFQWSVRACHTSRAGISSIRSQISRTVASAGLKMGTIFHS